MSQMRQRIASRLKESQNTAAMLTTFQEVFSFSQISFIFLHFVFNYVIYDSVICTI